MEEAQTQTDTQAELDEEAVRELTDLGVVFSHKHAKAHPNMREFVSANRHEMDVLDAEEVLKSMGKAIAFLAKTKAEGLILFVGTTVPAKSHVKALAEALGMPYVTHRWLGGTLTNFDMLRKRIDAFQELERQLGGDELAKYTKKEQLQMKEKFDKMKQKFDGLRKLTQLPAALFVVDANAHETALREAARRQIPVIAVMDSDDDPKRVACPIIANDHAASSIGWVIEQITKNVAQ